MSPPFLESKSSRSPACLESSPSLTGQDSSPSPSGFESKSSVCGLSLNPSPKVWNFPALEQVIFHNTINNIIVILIPLQVVSLC